MNYHAFSEFEWDPQKSDQCFKERGFDFEYVTQVFNDKTSVLRLDKRFE